LGVVKHIPPYSLVFTGRGVKKKKKKKKEKNITGRTDSRKHVGRQVPKSGCGGVTPLLA